MAFEYLIKTLKENELFKNVDTETIVDLIQKMHIKRVPSKTKIIKQGDKGDKFYVIRNGVVSVQIKTGLFSKKTIAQLTNGDCFGEMALVEDKPRSATVIAEDDTELFFLTKEAFNEIVMSNETLKSRILSIIEARRKNQ
jgi:CRP-like cAMP-binding protein